MRDVGLRRTPSARAVWPAVIATVAGCAPPPPGSSVPPEEGAGFVRRIAPFEVLDDDGRGLALAFLGGVNTPRPQLVDGDGDGDLDLVLQEVTGRMMFFELTGTRDGFPTFAWRPEVFAGVDVGEWQRLVDVDGDGDLDLLAEQPFSFIRYLRNEGRPGTARFVPAADTLRDAAGQPIFSDRQNIPFLGDLDCDGAADLLVGNLNGTVARYEETRSGFGAPPTFDLLSPRFEDIEIIGQLGSMHGANTMALADHDQDGDLDLFWGDFFEPGLLLIENSGSCQAPSLRSAPVGFPANEPVATSGYNAPAFGDLDSDGRLDLVVGVLGGAFNPNRTAADNLLLYVSAPDGDLRLRTRRLLPMIDVGGESVPSLVDFDRDGDLDLMLANKIEPGDDTRSRVHVFENVGGARAPSLRARGALELPPAFHHAPVFGDLDADGDEDLVLGSWGAGVAWYRNEGGPGVPGFALADSAAATLTRGSNTMPALADLDGDGDLDLLVGEAAGTLNLFRNEGDRTAPRFVHVSDTFGGIDVGRRSAPVFADLDTDGRTELLIGSESEGVALFRQAGPGDEGFVRDTTFALDVPALTAPAAGDLDGDGDLDLIIGVVGGGAYYFENRLRP
jgi:hypothetical protein